MKHLTLTARGGEMQYVSPALELVEFQAEQGFAGSGEDPWGEALDYNPVHKDGISDFE